MPDSVLRTSRFPGMTQHLHSLGAFARFHVHAWLESSLNHLYDNFGSLALAPENEKMLSLLQPALNCNTHTCDGSKQSTLSVNFHRCNPRHHRRHPLRNKINNSNITNKGGRGRGSPAKDTGMVCSVYVVCSKVDCSCFSQKLFKTPCCTARQSITTPM